MEEIKLGIKLNEEFIKLKCIKEPNEEEELTIEYEMPMEKFFECIIEENKEYIKEITSEDNTKRIVFGNLFNL